MSERREDSTRGVSPGRLIVVCGLPGSGKSTLARRLAEERQGVRLNADDWMSALDVNLWDADIRERVEALQWTLAQELLGVGVTVIIEWGTWSRTERDTLREGARELGAAVELHYLDVPPDQLWLRIRRRDAEDPPITRADVDRWAAQFEAPDPDEFELFDRL